MGSAVVRTQASVLNGLLAGDIAQRLIDSPEEAEPLRFRPSRWPSCMTGCRLRIGLEPPARSDVPQMRRDLQKEYIKSMLPFLAPDSKAPGDAVSLMRYQATELKQQIDEAVKGKLSLETRAHLAQCSQTLARALKAYLI